jgi:hypothetical protein
LCSLEELDKNFDDYDIDFKIEGDRVFGDPSVLSGPVDALAKHDIVLYKRQPSKTSIAYFLQWCVSNKLVYIPTAAIDDGYVQYSTMNSIMVSGSTMTISVPIFRSRWYSELLMKSDVGKWSVNKFYIGDKDNIVESSEFSRYCKKIDSAVFADTGYIVYEVSGLDFHSEYKYKEYLVIPFIRRLVSTISVLDSISNFLGEYIKRNFPEEDIPSYVIGRDKKKPSNAICFEPALKPYSRGQYDYIKGYLEDFRKEFDGKVPDKFLDVCKKRWSTDTSKCLILYSLFPNYLELLENNSKEFSLQKRDECRKELLMFKLSAYEYRASFLDYVFSSGELRMYELYEVPVGSEDFNVFYKGGDTVGKSNI